MATTKIPAEFLADNTIVALSIAENIISTRELAANGITSAQIASNAILTRHIDDNQITGDQIADNSVGTPQLAGIARGKIIVGDASGNPALLSLGSNGYVLKSDGSDITWAEDATVAALTTEQVQDIAGAMFSSNTETGIAATYQDGDGTIDLVIGANVIVSGMIAQNSILTRHIDDNQVTTDQIAANTIATANIADNAIDGTKIASNSILTRHIDDDQVTGAQLADALTVVTSVTTPLVDAAIVDGENFKVNGGQGSDGQVLTSTGSGVAWEDAAGGVAGISSSADATAITIDSSERVMIGSLTSAVSANAQKLQIANSGATSVYQSSLVLQSQQNDGNANVTRIGFYGGDGSSAARGFSSIEGGKENSTSGEYGGMISMSTRPHGGTSTERMRISSTGIMSVPNGIELGSGLDATAANILDDYEEGTWTPAFYTYSGVTTSSITITLATYTKIGNIVHIHANLTCTLSSLPGQTVTITGLPFAASGSDQYGIISIGGHTSNTGANTPKAHFRTNGSQLDGIAYNASSNTAYWTYSSMDAQPFEMSIHGFYTTT